jgi:hypothetical protein
MPDSLQARRALYERARFSSRHLHEAEFRDLMHLFAEILRGMTYSPKGRQMADIFSQAH